jgi:hypothetical protein
MTDTYTAIFTADLDSIEGIIKHSFSDYLSYYYTDEILAGVPPTPEHAYLARKLAFLDEISLEEMIKWQNYWFRCCISDKCNFIFSILSSKKISGDSVNREEDLVKI